MELGEKVFLRHEFLGQSLGRCSLLGCSLGGLAADIRASALCTPPLPRHRLTHVRTHMGPGMATYKDIYKDKYKRVCAVHSVPALPRQHLGYKDIDKDKYGTW